MLRKSLLIACAVAFLSALVPGTAASQDNWNQRTYFTFSAPVELPGKTLPAGTYLFRLVDSPSNRHVVQVFDKDETEVLITALAIPAQRLEPSGEPEVRFMEVAANQPAAIRTWWFPGRTIGHEFIYPKDQATRLAQGIRGSVLTVATDATTTETMRDAELARINESAQTTAVDTTTSTTAEVTGTAVTGRTTMETQTATATPPPAETQTATTTPPPAETPATTVPQSTAVTQREVETPATTPAMSTESVETTRTELPRTATVLPLVALFGFGSLAGAAALRLRRK